MSSANFDTYNQNKKNIHSQEKPLDVQKVKTSIADVRSELHKLRRACKAPNHQHFFQAFEDLDIPHGIDVSYSAKNSSKRGPNPSIKNNIQQKNTDKKRNLISSGTTNQPFAMQNTRIQNQNIDDIEEVLDDSAVAFLREEISEKNPINNSAKLVRQQFSLFFPSYLYGELKNVIIYMDQLLENLPEKAVDEFVRSKHFETYKTIFLELDLM
ncbi:MAG: hypothetical protein ACRC4W_06525 [Treponemataceae bacterium]